MADARARVRDGRRADRVAPAGAWSRLAVQWPGPADRDLHPVLLVRSLGPVRAGRGRPRVDHRRERLGAGGRPVDRPLAAAVPRRAPAVAPLAPGGGHVRRRDPRLRRRGAAAPRAARPALRPGDEPARCSGPAGGDGSPDRRRLAADVRRADTRCPRPRAAAAPSARRRTPAAQVGADGVHRRRRGHGRAHVLMADLARGRSVAPGGVGRGVHRVPGRHRRRDAAPIACTTSTS